MTEEVYESLISRPERFFKLYREIKFVFCHFKRIWICFQQFHFPCRILLHHILSNLPFIVSDVLWLGIIQMSTLHFLHPSLLSTFRDFIPFLYVYFSGTSPFSICPQSGKQAILLFVHFFGFIPFTKCLRSGIPSVISGLAFI